MNIDCYSISTTCTNPFSDIFKNGHTYTYDTHTHIQSTRERMGAYVINKQAGSNEPHRVIFLSLSLIFFQQNEDSLFASEI